MPLVSSGVEHGNLRELALARMKDMGTEVRLGGLLHYQNTPSQLVSSVEANRPFPWRCDSVGRCRTLPPPGLNNLHALLPETTD